MCTGIHMYIPCRLIQQRCVSTRSAKINVSGLIWGRNLLPHICPSVYMCLAVWYTRLHSIALAALWMAVCMSVLVQRCLMQRLCDDLAVGMDILPICGGHTNEHNDMMLRDKKCIHSHGNRLFWCFFFCKIFLCLWVFEDNLVCAGIQ